MISAGAKVPNKGSLTVTRGFAGGCFTRSRCGGGTTSRGGAGTVVGAGSTEGFSTYGPATTGEGLPFTWSAIATVPAVSNPIPATTAASLALLPLSRAHAGFFVPDGATGACCSGALLGASGRARMLG